MNAATDSKLNTQIYEEASEWLIAFRTAEPGPLEKQRLDAWLRRSPEHVKAYLELSAIWEDLALHDPARAVDAEAHTERARTEGNVVALAPASTAARVPTLSSNKPHRMKFSGRRLAMAASALLVVGALGVSVYNVRNPVYVTAVGEQRSVTLPDGSTVDLNARSRIRLHFSGQARDIELLEGQALFAVARDAARPFVVRSGGTAVRALGTQFDVSRRTGGTKVTVVEGRVAVIFTPAQGRSAQSGEVKPVSAVSLTAGEQIVVTDATPPTVRPIHTNVAAAIAWTQRRLIFDSAPLSEVAEEFNRYNTRQLVIRDPALRDFGVVGVFSSTDAGSLLKFLSEQPGIRVVEGETEILILPEKISGAAIPESSSSR